jgi:hypothetical protein
MGPLEEEMIHIIDLGPYLTIREGSSPTIDCNAREAVMYLILEEQHSEK